MGGIDRVTPSPEISALLVNHDGRRTILEAIRALMAQDYPVGRILVVDTGSRDGSPDLIRSAFPEVNVLELGSNPGPGYARNLGLSLIDAGLLLWLDDDIYLAPDCLGKMAGALQETGADVVCPRILFYPERNVIQCDGAGIHFCGTLSLNHTGRPAELRGGRTFPDAFGSACLLVRRERMLELGGFDEDFFFYFEDLELSYRLRARGVRICCQADSLAYHDRGPGTAALAFRGAGVYPAGRAYHLLRHRWMTVLMHFQLRTLFLLFPALAVYEAASFAECARRGWLPAWFRALFSVLGRAGRLFRRRHQFQELRRVDDRELLSGGPLPFAGGFVSGPFMQRTVDFLNRALNSYWDRTKRWL